MSEPRTGWNDDALRNLFANPEAYTNRATPLWNYTPVEPTNTSDPNSPTTGDPNPSPPAQQPNSGFPTYIPPLLGTLLGLFGLITILSIILFILRRRKQRRAMDAALSDTEGSTVRKHRQTWSWLRGVYGDDKSARGAHHQPLENPDDASAGYGTAALTADSLARASVMSPISPVTERSDPVSELQGKTIHEMPGMCPLLSSLPSLTLSPSR